MYDVEDFVTTAGLTAHLPLFRKAALAAQQPMRYESMPELDESERDALRVEQTHRWKHPRTL